MTISHENSDTALRPAGGQLNAGIVVFSSLRKALYLNDAARRVLIRLHQHENDNPANGALPRSLDTLLDEMLPLLGTANLGGGWKRLQARRLMAGPDRPILVNTFGISDRLDIQRALIVLTFQDAT